jgi:hypothetical protein
MNLIVEMLMNLIFVASMVILNFAIFKIPVKGNDKQIAVVALVVGLVNFYFKFIVDNPNFLLIQTAVYIILLTSLRMYPIIFAIIVSITGNIAVSLIDAVVTISSIQLHLSTMELMSNNILHFTIMHLITSLGALLIAYFLRRFNVGFSFIKMRFSGKHSLNTINFIWAGLMALVILALHFSTKSFYKNTLHTYIIIFFVLGLIASLIYAYFQNKKHLTARYGRKEGDR